MGQKDVDWLVGFFLKDTQIFYSHVELSESRQVVELFPTFVFLGMMVREEGGRGWG